MLMGLLKHYDNIAEALEHTNEQNGMILHPPVGDVSEKPATWEVSFHALNTGSTAIILTPLIDCLSRLLRVYTAQKWLLPVPIERLFRLLHVYVEALRQPGAHYLWDGDCEGNLAVLWSELWKIDPHYVIDRTFYFDHAAASAQPVSPQFALFCMQLQLPAVAVGSILTSLRPLTHVWTTQFLQPLPFALQERVMTQSLRYLVAHTGKNAHSSSPSSSPSFFHHPRPQYEEITQAFSSHPQPVRCSLLANEGSHRWRALAFLAADLASTPHSQRGYCPCFRLWLLTQVHHSFQQSVALTGRIQVRITAAQQALLRAMVHLLSDWEQEHVYNHCNNGETGHCHASERDSSGEAYLQAWRDFMQQQVVNVGSPWHLALCSVCASLNYMLPLQMTGAQMCRVVLQSPIIFRPVLRTWLLREEPGYLSWAFLQHCLLQVAVHGEHVHQNKNNNDSKNDNVVSSMSTSSDLHPLLTCLLAKWPTEPVDVSGHPSTWSPSHWQCWWRCWDIILEESPINVECLQVMVECVTVALQSSAPLEEELLQPRFLSTLHIIGPDPNGAEVLLLLLIAWWKCKIVNPADQAGSGLIEHLALWGFLQETLLSCDVILRQSAILLGELIWEKHAWSKWEPPLAIVAIHPQLKWSDMMNTLNENSDAIESEEDEVDGEGVEGKWRREVSWETFRRDYVREHDCD